MVLLSLIAQGLGMPPILDLVHGLIDRLRIGPDCGFPDLALVAEEAWRVQAIAREYFLWQAS